jgi:hypothetical protein
VAIAGDGNADNDRRSTLMKRKVSRMGVVAVSVALAATAVAQGRHDEKPHGMPKSSAAAAPAKPAEGGIALKDGGTLYIGKDGVTYHMDAAGNRVRMRDGQIMEGADGTRYMMRNDAVWRSITEKGTLHPSHN